MKEIIRKHCIAYNYQSNNRDIKRVKVDGVGREKKLLLTAASEESFFETGFALTSKQEYDAKQSARRVFTAWIVTLIANA